MKTMYSLLILFIVSVTACNQKKDSGNGRNNDNPSPNETGMYNGREVKPKEDRKDTLPRRPKTELQVQNMEAQVLGDSTKIGRPGDMLLTFTGGGFIFTDRNPILRMGREETSETYSNEEGTELYVVIPAQNTGKMMVNARSGGFSIVNPDKKEVRVAQNPEEMMGKIQKAGGEKVNLVYTTYGVTRKKQ